MTDSARGAKPDGLPEDWIAVEITPSPTEGERAAILVALRVMISGSAAAGSLRSAWTAAGRRESLFGSSQDVAARWRRGRDRLGAW